MLYIAKRDGSVVEFDKNKIINAINKAFIEVD
jgi:anaerobic ribonucleoside-triphosphate reductase